MDAMTQNIIDSITRWIHVFAGIVWIGHLYFFNFVNGPFAGTMDGETKKKVVPELMPRALYFFRWGAAWTWITGVILLTLVFHHNKQALADSTASFTGGGWAMVALTFLGVFVYDVLAKGPLKDTQKMFWGGWVLTIVSLVLFQKVGLFGFRGYAIHLGAMFGTIMAYNVWFRIWPAQQEIIAAIKGGTPPNADLVGLAGLRSRHNTYMSVPLIFMMLNFHNTWAATEVAGLPVAPAAIVLVGWLLVYWTYGIAAGVKGF